MIHYLALPVWAAGITYRRSLDGRGEEARDATPYDRVYKAPRPQLFFKCAPGHAVGDRGTIGLRDDSNWIVPEPELVVIADPAARIVGYTLGNDVSCRDIEGENVLYQSQAKIFTRSCALGPRLVTPADLPESHDLAITMTVTRNAGGGVMGEWPEVVFSGACDTGQMKRSPRELVDWLFRYNDFPNGVALMTGTGIVPPPDFTLLDGDVVSIRCEPIGVLSNTARVLKK